jgi:pimeloyl-ACP methyl ester carboxylesterase
VAVDSSYKDAPTRTVSAGGVDLAYRELGPKAGVPVNNQLVIYPDAGHGGIFQFHEQFVEKALEFLAK